METIFIFSLTNTSLFNESVVTQNKNSKHLIYDTLRFFPWHCSTILAASEDGTIWRWDAIDKEQAVTVEAKGRRKGKAQLK